MRQEAHQASFVVKLGRCEEYQRAKTILNKAKHPTFIGRLMLRRWADNGGLLFFQVAERDAAVALVNPKNNCLMALSVLPEHRGRGLGSAIINYLQCNFIRSTEERVPMFERLGYVAVSDWKQGRKLRTRILVKKSVMELAGRLKRLGELQTTDPAESRNFVVPPPPPLGIGTRRRDRPRPVGQPGMETTRHARRAGETARLC